MSPTVPDLGAFLAFAKGDDLGMVLRSHLALEAVLNRAIEDATADIDGPVELDRLPFMSKVDVAIILRKVPPYLRPAFVQANRLRNHFAHHLDAHVSNEDANQLLGAFPPDAFDGFMFRAYQAARTSDVRDRSAFALAALFLHSAIYAGAVDVLASIRETPG
jgi:hypothetical protein